LFGQTPLNLGGKVQFYEFLQSITDAPILVRNGMPQNTADFIDLPTKSLTVAMVTFAPEYGLARTISNTATLGTEISVDYAVGHFQALEGDQLEEHKWVSYVGFVLAAVILVEKVFTIAHKGVRTEITGCQTQQQVAHGHLLLCPHHCCTLPIDLSDISASAYHHFSQYYGSGCRRHLVSLAFSCFLLLSLADVLFVSLLASVSFCLFPPPFLLFWKGFFLNLSILRIANLTNFSHTHTQTFFDSIFRAQFRVHCAWYGAICERQGGVFDASQKF